MRIPKHLKLTPSQEKELGDIRRQAVERHEKARIAASKKGRTNFPLLPYECSWAFEETFRKRKNT